MLDRFDCGDRDDLTTLAEAHARLVGAQVGSRSRNAFSRPYASAEDGMFLFFSENSYQVQNTTTYQYEDETDSIDTLIRPGAELSVGAAFSFNRHRGIGAELSYKIAFNLRHRVPDSDESSNAQSQGIHLIQELSS